MTKEDEIRALGIYGKYIDNSLGFEDNEAYTYHHLASVKWVYGTEVFKGISNKVFDINVNHVKKKEKIKIAFLNIHVSTWACEKLYRMLENDERFEPYIIVVPFFNGTNKTIRDSYLETVNYFLENKYSVIEGYNVSTERHLGWDEVGIPDIIFHQNPHYKGFRDAYKIYNIPLSVLNIYIPYAFMQVNDYYAQNNQMTHLLYWKIFCETEHNRRLFGKHCDKGNEHVIACGYAKMDMFLDSMSSKKIRDIWKIKDVLKAEKVVKIIYAPHHSLYSGLYGFSTFDMNYLGIYNLAKKYSEETSWIIKPHPLLKKQSVLSGLFKDEKEYDDYIKMWDDLPNAKSVEDDPYFDIFKTSDGMIFDSQSFRMEYFYVGKPSLYLNRVGKDYALAFDELGLAVKDIIYSVDGNQINLIKKFIDETLIGKKDYRSEERIAFYKKYLDYPTYNDGVLANEYIYNFLKSSFKF